MKTTAEIIKQARLDAGLTQQDIETLYDIPFRRLSEWERSVHEPPAYVVTLLLKCLKADFPPKEEPQAEPVLSAPKKVIYTDAILNKTLKEPLLSVAKQAYEDGKVTYVPNENYEGFTSADEERKGKLYMVTEPERYGDDIPFGFSFRRKEV